MCSEWVRLRYLLCALWLCLIVWEFSTPRTIPAIGSDHIGPPIVSVRLPIAITWGRVVKERRTKVYLGLCMSFVRLQPSMWRALDRQTTQTWWLANMVYKARSKLRLLGYCFFCGCHLMFLVPQVHALSFIPFEQVGLSKYTWMSVKLVISSSRTEVEM